MSKYAKQSCWDCQRAVVGCPWSTMARPIEGWTAVKTKIPNGCGSEFTESYHITACPLFKRDERGRNKIAPGQKISTMKLAEFFGTTVSELQNLSDDDIIALAAEKGVLVDIVHDRVRHVYVRRCKNGSM